MIEIFEDYVKIEKKKHVIHLTCFRIEEVLWSTILFYRFIPHTSFSVQAILSLNPKIGYL